MTRFIVVKCEVCPNEIRVPSGIYDEAMPDPWIALIQTRCEPRHLCSGICHLAYVKRLMGDTQLLSQEEAPQTKMRRFLLVDEDAEITEGIQWSDGFVCLCSSSDHCANRFHCQGYFRSWDEFKSGHEGCGVTWIDQEVSDAS